MGEIKVSPDYNWFRSTVPLKKVRTAVIDFQVKCLLLLCSGEPGLSPELLSHVLCDCRKYALDFHMLLRGHILMWWWGTERLTVLSYDSSAWSLGALTRRKWFVMGTICMASCGAACVPCTEPRTEQLAQLQVISAVPIHCPKTKTEHLKAVLINWAAHRVPVSGEMP